MLITLNRGGELWWIIKKPPYGRYLYLRYGIKQSGVSRLSTFGYVVQPEDGDCVPCTDDGVPLLYKAKYGPDLGDVAYMETREQAMELVLHMSHGHAAYLRQPVPGRSWCQCMMPFLTKDYIWERVQC